MTVGAVANTLHDLFRKSRVTIVALKTLESFIRHVFAPTERTIHTWNGINSCHVSTLLLKMPGGGIEPP